MRYFRCKCGDMTAHGSDSPPPCDGCPKCNTTLESHPDHHTEPQPHRFGEPEWTIDAKTGERRQVQRCQNSYCREERSVPAEAPEFSAKDLHDLALFREHAVEKGWISTTSGFHRVLTRAIETLGR